jgi:hypothetical protein
MPRIRRRKCKWEVVGEVKSARMDCYSYHVSKYDKDAARLLCSVGKRGPGNYELTLYRHINRPRKYGDWAYKTKKYKSLEAAMIACESPGRK